MAKVESSLKTGFCVAFACGALIVPACSDKATDAPGSGSGGSSGTGAGPGTGGSGTGGSSGDGGIVTGPSKCDGHYFVATGHCSILDNFEADADGPIATKALPLSDGRNGMWSAPDKETKTGTTVMVSADVAPLDSPNADLPNSTKALHFTVSNAIDWGGDVGVALGPCYDLSQGQYTGIKFWAKAAKKVTILTGVHTADSHGSYDCPLMVPDTCWGAYRTDVTIDVTWKKFEFTWAQLAQPTWAHLYPFNAKKIVSMIFSSKDTTPVDVWIDDPGFQGGDDTMCVGGSPGDDGGTSEPDSGGTGGGSGTPDGGGD